MDMVVVTLQLFQPKGGYLMISRPKIQAFLGTYQEGAEKLPVHLQLHPGVDPSSIFLTGSSGSGKSTLLNMIGGLETPTAGVLTIDGKDRYCFLFKQRKGKQHTAKTTVMRPNHSF